MLTLRQSTGFKLLSWWEDVPPISSSPAEGGAVHPVGLVKCYFLTPMGRISLILFSALQCPLNGRSPESQLRRHRGSSEMRQPCTHLVRWGKAKAKGQHSSVRHSETGDLMLTRKDCHRVWTKCFWPGRDRVKKNFGAFLITSITSFLSQAEQYWYLKDRILKENNNLKPDLLALYLGSTELSQELERKGLIWNFKFKVLRFLIAAIQPTERFPESHIHRPLAC